MLKASLSILTTRHLTDLGHAHGFHVADNGDDQAAGRRDGHADVHVVTVHNLRRVNEKREREIRWEGKREKREEYGGERVRLC